MKFICSTVVNQPIEKTVSLWQDELNFAHWQDGFQSIRFIEGEKHAVDSVREIRLQQGKNEMLLTETVLENKLPEKWKSFVHHKHMDNTQTVSFQSIDNNKTSISSEIEYTEFRHFMPQIMAKLFPSMFKKQVQKWLDQFSEFANQQ